VRLADPLAVTVSDAQGQPVPRGEVRWSITDGDGASLSDAVTVADGTGRAAVWLTLGPTAGQYVVRATLAANSSVSSSFTAAAAAAPTLSGVAPGSFTGGDTLTLSGTRLADTLQVEVAGELARVLSATPSGDALDVVVPRCLVPGSVSVAVAYGGTQLDALPGTYQASSGPLTLEVGEYSVLDPITLNGCATFPTAGPGGAEYLMTPQSAASVPGVSAAYRFRGDAAAPVSVRTERRRPERTHAERFHDFLRERENEYSRLPRRPLLPEAVGPAGASGIELGDQRNFKVCAALPCATRDFVTVTARARYVGLRAVIYEDLEAPDPITDEDAEDFGSEFDDELYDVATRAFGSESDVDRNGVLFILMTPVVNGLTPEESCGQAIITGFFFALDVDPAFQDDPRSNGAEVFFSLTADAAGDRGCPVSGSIVRRLVPVTFIHELQHMISFNQHVLVRGGNSEHTWLNEGLSHLSEELAALHFFALADSVRGSQFALGDMFNAYSYLGESGSNFLLFLDGTGSLPERGASWLFLRWVVDQFGDGVTRRLVETNLLGPANVEAAAGEPFERLLSDWFLAIYVSDLPGFTAPARLKYTTWSFRTTFASLHGQLPSQFPQPFPIVPPTFSGGVFNVLGDLHAGSGDYYLAQQSAGQQGFTVELTDPAGDDLSGLVVPRLNVVRIR
jgi:hypothetical protein